ncbi:NAD(P)-dependent oxidoreductase [Streptomyces sp. NPDC056821]|uniref:NAD(P)-dependent oxidoreductase n=1 Tax=unclassified Streptomyces TaxID=2593676 RepID=UPI0036B1D216
MARREEAPAGLRPRTIRENNMHLIFGLGPIGGNIGERLAELNREVFGFDLAQARVHEWAAATNAPASSDLARVHWAAVDSVIVAVRTADQVSSVFRSLQECCAERPLSVFVVSTLAAEDARRILPSAPDSWRVFEAPVSGGPHGARHGTLTTFLSGPVPTDAEERLLADISGRVFRMRNYGDAATVKLLNNTLGTYNLLSTAHMLNLAQRAGVPAKDFLEVIRVSSGQSWMSDNFSEVQYDLLLKDVGLLRGEVGSLPATDLSGDVEQEILQARGLLESEA